MRERIRILQEGDIALDTKIQRVDKDGNVIADISDRVHTVDIHLKVGEPALATIGVFAGSLRIDAQLEDVIVTHIGRTRLGRLRWRISRWWHAAPKTQDATPFTARSKQVVNR